MKSSAALATVGCVVLASSLQGALAVNGTMGSDFSYYFEDGAQVTAHHTTATAPRQPANPPCTTSS